MIGAGDVIGNEINNGDKSCLTATSDECFKFNKALSNIDGEVGVNIIVIDNGIGAAFQAFYNADWLRRKAGLGRLSGVSQYAREPYMRHAKFFDFF